MSKLHIIRKNQQPQQQNPPQQVLPKSEDAPNQKSGSNLVISRKKQQQQQQQNPPQQVLPKSEDAPNQKSGSNLVISRKKQQQAPPQQVPKEILKDDFPSLPPSEPTQPQQSQAQSQSKKKRDRQKGKKAQPQGEEPQNGEGNESSIAAKDKEGVKEDDKVKGTSIATKKKEKVEEGKENEEEEKIIEKGPKEMRVDDNDVKGLAVPPVERRVVGRGVNSVELLSNYYSVILSPGKVIYEYIAIFKYDIALKRKKKILESHKELGVFVTDGNHLYTPGLLSPDKLSWEFRLEEDEKGDEKKQTVKLKKTKEIKGNDQDIWRVLNIIKGKLLQKAGMQRIGRNYFKMEEGDAVIIKEVPNITFFPGITASFMPIQKGAAFVADILYKAVRKDTVLDLIYEARRIKKIPEKAAILSKVRGISVITMYSNRPYIIDDVDFTLTPKSTFEWKRAADEDVKKVSYLQYVVERYGKRKYTTVTDLNQPMLIVNRKSGEKTYLIPELCRLTGIPEKMRQDYRIMKPISDKTHPTPSIHAEEINRYARLIGKKSDSGASVNPESPVSYMRPWGISLASEMLPIKGAILEDPKIIVGGRKKIPGISTRYPPKPDFTSGLRNSAANTFVPIVNWVVVVQRDNEAETREFVNNYLNKRLEKLGGNGATIPQPTWVLCNYRDFLNSESIKVIINRDVVPKKPTFALFVLADDRADSYNTIKHYVCSELKEEAFPTQVIKYRTLSSPKKVEGVSIKVALQILVKLGGVGYSVEITDPVLREGTMVVGIDVCHKGSAFKKDEKKSVVGLVASVDNTFVHCWAESRIQEHRKEIVTDLVLFVEHALAAYQKKNLGKLPNQVIVYRDGVGDGQLGIVRDYEVTQFEDAFRRRIPDKAKHPKLVFIVVKKNTNTRLFAKNRGTLANPRPGTVIDSEIVHKDWYEFFLVPHIANQGMVSPTNFVVVKDNLRLDRVALQTFTYHQCFVYQNWSGSIKVPAMCQNAHKLSYLVGESIADTISDKLSDKQFFL